MKRGTVFGPAITDVAGEGATPLQLERLCNRYYWASDYCRGRTVLEVACGTGQGLGYLKARAAVVLGGDLSFENLSTARATYGSCIPVIRMDALELPVRESSLDVVLLLETIYFLRDADRFVAEARRVLRSGGYLLLSAINKDCTDYNPHNQHYHGHYGAIQLAELVERHGFEATCFGALPMDQQSGRSRWLAPVKRLASRLHLIPQGMQAKLWLKKLAYGGLSPMPFEIRDDSAPYRTPLRIAGGQQDSRHQVVLCEARAT